jgi:hypothetical protein
MAKTKSLDPTDRRVGARVRMQRVVRGLSQAELRGRRHVSASAEI